MRKAHVRPEGPVGAWRASHAMLWFLEVLRWSPAGLIFHERPSVTLSPRRGVLFSVLRSLFSGARQRPLSYMSYWSYRIVLWHVADVPGVQGRLEVWKFRGLEVWLCTTACPSRACARSVLRGRGRFGPLGLHALFSVFRSPGRACAPLPLPGCGAAPHFFQSANQLISRALWWSAHVFVEKTFSGARRRSGRGGRACGRRAGGWDGR